jgi:integrase
MATISKRINADGSTSYKVQVRLKGYPAESATFERKTDASEWGKKTEAEMKAGRHFGISKRHTFKDLAHEYQLLAKDPVRLAYWLNVFGDYTLDAITPAKITKEKNRLLNDETSRYTTPATGDPILDAKRVKLKRSGATVNRYLASLSSCLNYGVKTLQWIESNPCEKIEKPKENKGRVRFLSDDERVALLKSCAPHSYLYLAVILALSTGARKSEIMSLRFGQIDFLRKVITLHETKNGDKRALPLVGKAYDLLKERAKVRELSDDRVFPPSKLAKNSKYLDLRQPWENALKLAGIVDFRFHDLRHTSASYMAMSGVSLVEISKILGQRTMQMVSRYSHLSEGHIVATGEKLASRLGI